MYVDYKVFQTVIKDDLSGQNIRHLIGWESEISIYLVLISIDISWCGKIIDTEFGILYSSVADPVQFFWIRIRGSVFYLVLILDVQQNKYVLWHFLDKSKHPMRLKIKDKKLFGRNCILDNEKIWITGVFLWIKDPDPGPVFSRIRVT